MSVRHWMSKISRLCFINYDRALLDFHVTDRINHVAAPLERMILARAIPIIYRIAPLRQNTKIARLFDGFVFKHRFGWFFEKFS